MDFPFGEWHDGWRIIAALACLVSLWFLFKRFRHNRDEWNSKTRDYWFSLVMWTLAGFVGCVQGVYLNYPFGPALVFTTAAVIVSLKGLFHKGDWGGRDS